MNNIIAKTIARVTMMKKTKYDDTGWLRLDFTDGTHCVIVSGYDEYTGASEDEYPTRIRITDDVKGLIPSQESEDM